MVEEYSFELPLCICTLSHGGRLILIDLLYKVSEYRFIFYIDRTFLFNKKKTNKKILTIVCV